MNAERLLELADLLSSANSTYNMQGLLDDLRNQFDQLASNPGHPDFQRGAATALQSLSDAMIAFEGGLTPARLESLQEMGATPYFTSSLPLGIQSLMSTSGVVPSVVRDRTVELQEQRAEYIHHIDEVRRGLRAVGITVEITTPGVEAGFLIPRILFGNTLDGLGKEFEQITKIIAVFSELATGYVEPVEVRQISTTDPLVIVGLATPVAIAFAKGIDWVLETTKKILELKKLYDQNKSAKVPDSILDGLKEHIQKSVSEALEEHGKKLVDTYPVDDDARKNELNNHIKWAMEQLFAKVERGMTVELRLLPPPPGEEIDEQGAAEQAQTFADLAAISGRLDFPKILGEPLLALGKPDGRDEA